MYIFFYKYNIIIRLRRQIGIVQKISVTIIIIIIEIRTFDVICSCLGISVFICDHYYHDYTSIIQFDHEILKCLQLARARGNHHPKAEKITRKVEQMKQCTRLFGRRCHTHTRTFIWLLQFTSQKLSLCKICWIII